MVEGKQNSFTRSFAHFSCSVWRKIPILVLSAICFPKSTLLVFPFFRIFIVTESPRPCDNPTRMKKRRSRFPGCGHQHDLFVIAILRYRIKSEIIKAIYAYVQVLGITERLLPYQVKIVQLSFMSF